jgi:hypothetical protein
MAALPTSELLPTERSVSSLAPRPVAWLWPGRLALGKLELLDGDPGVGKSLVTLDLCARLSTGRHWPDGSPGPGASGALVLNAEDDESDTICPRLSALGADLARVFVLPHGGRLRLPVHLETLARAVDQTAARLVVIDPVIAFLEARLHSGNDQSIRQALHPLAELAERFACAVLLIRHLSKGGRGRSLYRGYGSVGFLGACRSGWLIAPDPHTPGRRVLAQVKNNLAAPQPSLAFEVRAPAPGAVAVDWLGECAWAADQLTAGPGLPAGGELPRARAFLEAALQAGPRTTRELWVEALGHGLSRRTLFRAKSDLGIRSEEVAVGGKRHTYWLLADQHLPDTIPAEDRFPDLEAWFARMRQQFPPLTPLDELETEPR